MTIRRTVCFDAIVRITCIYKARFSRRVTVLYLPGTICNIRRVKSVPRLPADIRISLKKRGGKTYRIELIRQPTGRRFWVRKDGKHSSKVPEATATQVAERIRRWLVANT